MKGQSVRIDRDRIYTEDTQEKTSQEGQWKVRLPTCLAGLDPGARTPSREKEAGRSAWPLTSPVAALCQPETQSRVQTMVDHASQSGSFCSCESTKDLRSKNDN